MFHIYKLFVMIGRKTRIIKLFYMNVLEYNDPQNLNVYERLWLYMPMCIWHIFLFLARPVLVHGVNSSASTTWVAKKIEEFHVEKSMSCFFSSSSTENAMKKNMIAFTLSLFSA